MSVLLTLLTIESDDRNSYAAMEYFRYNCRCNLHTEVTLLVGVGHSEYTRLGVPWHIHVRGGGGLRCGHNPKRGS